MSKGLEALHHPRIKSARVDISAEGKHDIAYMRFDDTKQYTAIENELKEYEMEHTLRVRLENVNYELVREKQENEKKLKRLEELEKAFVALSKEDEKAKKLLSLEIEKNRALNEIVALHDKWLGNEMSDFEFFTLLNDIRDKYGLLEGVSL